MTVEQVQEEFPAWHVWTWMGNCYARRLKSSPPVVFRAPGPDGLRKLIRQWEEQHPW